MNVNTRLDECLGFALVTRRTRDGSGSGPCNQTLTIRLERLMNYRTKLKKVFIRQLNLRLVVQVNEKLEMFSLLLDNIQFRS